MIKRSQGFKTAAAATKVNKKMSIGKAHHLLGHTNRCATINTAKNFCLDKLKDSCVIYQLFAEAKTKRNYVPQARRAPRSKTLNKRLYQNLAMVKAQVDIAEKVNKPNWEHSADKATGIKVAHLP